MKDNHISYNYDGQKQKLEFIQITSIDKKKKKVYHLLHVDKEFVAKLKKEKISVDDTFACTPRINGCYQLLTMMVLINNEVCTIHQNNCFLFIFSYYSYYCISIGFSNSLGIDG